MDSATLMHGQAIGLLICFGIVLGLGFAFACVVRYHLRTVRRANRSLDPLAPLTGARRRALALPSPNRWLVVRTTNTAFLREQLGLADAETISWSAALSRCSERALFVSPPIDGWSLVVGGDLPDAAADVDVAFRFLMELSAMVGEVHFYSADRVLNAHTWVRIHEGRVVRAYAWAGETLWNEGRPTLDELLLGLRCREYGEQAETVRYGETPPEQHNAERVVLLARRWSIDPIVASEILIQQEAATPDDDGEPGTRSK
jgi:hypothetical protein